MQLLINWCNSFHRYYQAKNQQDSAKYKTFLWILILRAFIHTKLEEITSQHYDLRIHLKGLNILTVCSSWLGHYFQCRQTTSYVFLNLALTVQRQIRWTIDLTWNVFLLLLLMLYIYLCVCLSIIILITQAYLCVRICYFLGYPYPIALNSNSDSLDMLSLPRVPLRVSTHPLTPFNSMGTRQKSP